MPGRGTLAVLPATEALPEPSRLSDARPLAPAGAGAAAAEGSSEARSPALASAFSALENTPENFAAY